MKFISKIIGFILLIGFNIKSFGFPDEGAKVENSGNTYTISIGIDDYKSFPLLNCKKDAVAIHKILQAQAPGKENKHFLLLDASATRDSILQTLKRIASLALPADRFIFFYAGFSVFNGKVPGQMETHFCPFGSINDLKGKQLTGDTVLPSFTFTHLISMKLLQEYVQLIPCRNQMFIAEAASTENLNAEFASALMQGSPDIAALQNINRIIVAPKQIGVELKNGGMLAVAIQQLDTSRYKITDLFLAQKSAAIAQAIINNCKPDYASVFFEKDFIKLYQQINSQNPLTRSKTVKLNLPDPVKQALANKRKYALLIGIEHYKAKGWGPLNNPIKDAEEIGSVLKDLYGYDTILLKDPTADIIYNNLLALYSKMGPDDDFILYVAGHGDYDQALLDDGFLVCIDSKPAEEDLMRNSYIAHSKLKRILNKLPAKNVLVLLDICHAGTFDEKVLGGQSREGSADQLILKRNINQFFLEKNMYSTRKVLTSVGKQPAFDGDAGKHSPFATYLLKLLYGAGGDMGMLTASDIFSSLQKAGLNEDTKLRIYPHQAAFGKHDPEGEFILLPVIHEK